MLLLALLLLVAELLFLSFVEAAATGRIRLRRLLSQYAGGSG
ncbi:MAG: hypothetical protein U0Z44_01590 [Kouleothrix sp.]